jgi:tetratricopeptide (TPR) repeat protein
MALLLDAPLEHAAQALIQGHSLGAAEIGWEAVLLAPNDPRPRSLLGQCYLQLGRLEESQALLLSALQQGSALAEDHSTLALVSLRRGHFSAAAEQFTETLGLADKQEQAAAARDLGQVLLKLGRYPEAIEAFQRARRSDPRQRDLLLDLAAAHNLDGEYAAALETLQQLGTTSTAALLERSRALFFLGRYQEAAAAAEQAEKLDPDLPAAPRAAARAWFELRRFEPASEALQRALHLDSQDPDTLQLQIDLLSAQQLLPEAIQAARIATTASPARTKAWLELGRLLAQAGERSGAIAALEQARALEPEMAAVHYQLARLYREDGNLPAAERSTQEFTEIGMPSGPGGEAYDLGSRLLTQNRPLAALPLLEQAGAAEPQKKPRIVLRLAQALDALGREAPALETYDRAEKLGAPLLELLAYRGELLRRMGDYERSEKDLARAFELRQGTVLGARASRALGELRRRRGDFEGARSAYRAALAIDPRDLPSSRGLELCEAALADERSLTQLSTEGLAERISALDRAAETGAADPWAYQRLAKMAAAAGAASIARVALGRDALLRPLDDRAARRYIGALALEGQFETAAQIARRTGMVAAQSDMSSDLSALAAAAKVAKQLQGQSADPPDLATIGRAAAPFPAVAAYLEGGLALKGGDAPRALESFRRSTGLEPSYFRAWLQLGHAQRNAGRYQEALSAYECAVTLERDSSVAHLNLGVTLAHLGRLDAAETELETTCRLDPALAEAFRNLAAVRILNGHPQQAQEPLEQAARLGADVSALRAQLDQALTSEKPR